MKTAGTISTAGTMDTEKMGMAAKVFIIGDWDGGGGLGGYTGETPTNGIAPVPESATMLLLGAGLIGLAVYGRKKLN